jgi:hypothetical protein
MQTDVATKLKRAVLMLSSPHEGEQLAAVRAIDRLLKGAGQDWHSFADRIGNDNAVTPRQIEQLKQLAIDQHHQIERLQRELDEANARAHFADIEERDWCVLRDFCLARKSLLRPREVEFVESLRRWRSKLSKKQMDWLVSLCLRLKRAPT